MTGDPRARLLEGADPDGYVARPVLEDLDRVRVVVRAGADVTGSSSVAAAAFIGICARLFGDVVIEAPLPLAPNWWGATDADALLDLLAGVRPRPGTPRARDVIVTFGDAVAAGDWGVGGDDYTARLGREPQPLLPGRHALGVHAAVCLAVSQLLVEVLAPHGFGGVPLRAPYVLNLIDHRAVEAAPQDPARRPAGADRLHVAVAGVGSVATSALALLAGAVAPALAGHREDSHLDLVLVDPDRFDPTRNPYRYPALLGGETARKADLVAGRLVALGLDARAEPSSLADWARSRSGPGFDGLVVSSVDTLDGRRDVTDLLAREWLSLGVSGLALHAQRESLGDGFACPFCDYVSAAPPSTRAGVDAETTGLPVTRVLYLLQEGRRLEAADVDAAVAAGRLAADRREQMIGAPLSDLVRQAYAEIALRGAPGQAGTGTPVAVAAPQVSWFAGVLAAVEIVKQLDGLPLLDRRVDVDLAGLPPGLVRRPPEDSTGRCLCRSGTRRRWHRELYGP